MEISSFSKVAFEILVASGALAFGVKYVLEQFKRGKETKVKENYADQAELYNILHEAHNKLDTDRIAIVRIENGGSIPSIDGPMYSTVLHEAYGKGVTPLQGDWKKVALDSYYIKAISDLVKHGEIQLHREDMEGMLETLYGANKHLFNDMFLIRTKPERLTFISFVYGEDSDPELTDSKKLTMKMAVEKIKKLFDKV